MRASVQSSEAHTMPYTLAEAAQMTGLNRSTILRAIRNGRISGVRDELGAWSVEPSELHQVFPPARPSPRPCLGTHSPTPNCESVPSCQRHA